MKECIFIEFESGIFIYGDINIKDDFINYRKSKTIKNRKRQSWYDVSKIFTINYIELKSNDFGLLKKLIYSNTVFQFFYQNEKYNGIISVENGFEYKSEYSELLKDDLYSGTIIIEQIFEEGDNEW